MADTKSILQLGIEAAHAGDKAEARELFRLATREKPDNAQGWLWLAGVAEDREEKRTALERVLALDPNNELARKGLAAMGGAAATGGAAAVASGSLRPDPTPPAEADAPAGTPDADAPAPQGADDATPAVATPVAADATPVVAEDDNARTYDTPDASGTSDTTTTSTVDDDTWTPVFADDDSEREDYQQTPRADDDDYEPAVVVEDEEERRGGIGWLPWVLGLVALALIAWLAWGFISNRGDTGGTAQGPGGVEIGVTADATSSAAGGGVVDGTGVTATAGEGGLPIEGTAVGGEAGATAVPGDAGATAAPGDAGATVAPPAEGQPAPPIDATVPATDPAAGAEQTAPPVTDPAAGAEQTAAPPADQPTVIVVVPPDATVVPPVVEPTTAPAPPAAEPTTAPAPPPVSTGGDVATANPAVVPVGTSVQAGPWNFEYRGAQNTSPNAFAGATPSQGLYQIVVVVVTNNSGEAATIPDGFFVLKDAQGRVYEFNRAASVDYVNRTGRGVAADIAADEQVPPGALLSTGLLFDVAPDATNLVLFSRENVNQGFLIR
jgi:hypothetical protein